MFLGMPLFITQRAGVNLKHYNMLINNMTPGNLLPRLFEKTFIFSKTLEIGKDIKPVKTKEAHFEHTIHIS